MLRDYQQKITDEIDIAFNEGAQSLLVTCPTGGGKTHLISHRARLAGAPTVDQAHRKELIYQISMALARDGIPHRVLADQTITNFIIEKQIEIYKTRWVYPDADHTVASVDMLLARADQHGNWIKQVGLVQTDEGHHCLADNKWGRAINLFPNARRIGWTGTGRRPDGQSLRLGKGGVYDRIIVGPSTAELLARGFLALYKIFGPPPSIDMSGAAVGSSGDFVDAEIRRRAHKSTITGDLVAHYLRFLRGKATLAFLVDIDQARETAERFQAVGVRAVWMSSKYTSDRDRVKNTEAFRNREIDVICNVDLFGEGVDIPIVEGILDGRPTASIVRYLQTFGRLLRPSEGKEFGIYVDAVGNVMRHQLPEYPHAWSLDVPEKRKNEDDDESLKIKMCVSCFQIMKAFRKKCPHCGHVIKPGGGGVSRPEEVDGDLTEYSPEMLSRLRGEADRIMSAANPGWSSYIKLAHNQRFAAQKELRPLMDWWAGHVVETQGINDPAELYRMFYLRFGVDVATAATLGRPETEKLIARIRNHENRD